MTICDYCDNDAKGKCSECGLYYCTGHGSNGKCNDCQ